MKTTVSAAASATLAAVDTALRRAGDLHWTDPEFQRWEAGQVGELIASSVALDQPDGLIGYNADPGPAHSRHSDAEIITNFGSYVRPMISFKDDHGCLCERSEWVPPLRPGGVRAWEYPPEDTVHGPLLLGPEPETVLAETRGHVMPDPVVVRTVRMCDPVEVVAW